MDDSMYSTELQAQADSLAERKALLAARAKQAAAQLGIYAPPQASNEEVGGFASAMNPGFRYSGRIQRQPIAAALTPVIAQARDAYAGDQLRSDEAAYRAREQAAEQAALRSFPQGTPATPYSATPTNAPSDANPGGNFVEASVTPARAAVAATPQDRLNWASEAGKVPSLRDTVKSLITDQIVKEPDRIETRLDRQATREATIAEAQRKQREELEYRRQRDEQAADLKRDLAQQSNDLRRDLHAAIASSGSSGKGDDKAANWRTETAPDGSIIYRNVISGATMQGGQGHQDPAFVKDNLQRKETIDNANEGLRIVDNIRKVLPSASSSVYEAGKGWVASKFNVTTDVAKANAQLETLSGNLTSMIPRMQGPVSDADLRFLSQQAADAANDKKTTGQRMAALDRAQERLSHILKTTPPPVARANTTIAPPTSSGNPPTVRDSVKEAVRQQQGGWSVEKVN